MPFLNTNVFQPIIDKKIETKILFENEQVMAFPDISPKAKTHILIIPKANIITAKEVSTENLETFGMLFLAAKQIAQDLNLEGYKLHMNVDEKGGQVVPHLHLHLLSADFKTGL